MKNSYLTIDPFLTASTDAYCARLDEVDAVRVRYLDTLLRQCVEELAFDVQCVECRALLTLERAFNPANPYATSMSLTNLLNALFSFVHVPWLRSDVAMAAAQWKFVRALLDALEQSPLALTARRRADVVMLRKHITAGLKATSQGR